MKFKFLLLIAFMLAMNSISHAQVMPDTNLVWLIKYDYRIGSSPKSIQISPDGVKVFVSNSNGNIFIVDFETGSFIDSIMGYGALAGFSQDGNYFYTYTYNNIYKFNTSNNQIITHLDSFPGGKGKFNQVSIISDDRLVATLGEKISLIKPDYLFFIIDGDSLKIQYKIPQYNDSTFSPQYTYLPSSSMFNFCISPGDSLMAVHQDFLVSSIFPATYKEKLNIWNLKNMTIIKDIPPMTGGSIYAGMSFLPNSTILILSIYNYLYFYDYQKNQTIQTLSPIAENFCISNNNQRIYYGILFNNPDIGIVAENLFNYQELCRTLVPTEIGTGVIMLSNDENYLISGSAGVYSLMKLKNCYFNTEVPKIHFRNDTLIMPNPVSENLNIRLNNDFTGTYNFSVNSINGNLVLNNTINLNNGSGSIIVSDLPNGSYILTLNNSSNYFTFKFIVIR